MNPVTFVRASPADAIKIASLHATSWRDAYRGILPAAFLAGPVDEERSEFWRARLSSPGEARRHVLLAEAGGQPVGFVCTLLDADPGWGALLDNLHVLPRLKGQGIGRALFLRTTQWVMASEPGWPIHLWVFEANHPARRFYDRLNGEMVEHRLYHAPGGLEIPSLRYVWRDPKRLYSDIGGSEEQ